MQVLLDLQFLLANESLGLQYEEERVSAMGKGAFRRTGHLNTVTIDQSNVYKASFDCKSTLKQGS